MNMRSRVSVIAAGCLMASTFGIGPAVAADKGQQDLAEVRKATARFHDVEAAIAAGYAPTDVCVPEMGYHYINHEQFGGMDPTTPDALIYAANKQGKLRLVAVEWFQEDADQDLTTDEDRPSMFGRGFDGPMPGHEPGMPVHYDLHAWVWFPNPNGILEPNNPKIECPGA